MIISKIPELDRLFEEDEGVLSTRKKSKGAELGMCSIAGRISRPEDSITSAFRKAGCEISGRALILYTDLHNLFR